MSGYDLSHITGLETVDTHEDLRREVDDIIRASSIVQAVVERMNFDTGEYAVLIRGVVATAEPVPVAADGPAKVEGETPEDEPSDAHPMQALSVWLNPLRVTGY